MTRDTFKAKGTPPPTVVDEAMVKRAVAAVMSAPAGISVESYVRIVLEAALAEQREPKTDKADEILPAGRNPPAPEGSVKPAPPPNPPKAQGMVDGWRLVVHYSEYDSKPIVCAEKDGSLVWIANFTGERNG